ncbi:MAG TPA: FAD binding domain-containing protein [Thermoanaerobaculia bacterium]|nr:FAD binding domain-containing protein [Thermoanaerobaculia bacterium]
MRESVTFYLNGKRQAVDAATAMQSLSRYLRYDLRETGTKIVCEEGDCGACTVLIGRRENGAMRYRPINSCITFLFQLDCTHVVSVEGLTHNGKLTPLQDAMVRCHGAQCGYCTPGFIMAMQAMYEMEPRLEPGKRPAEAGASFVRAALTGNLCRCTGYEPIIKAALEVEKQPAIDELYPSAEMLREFETLERDPVRFGSFFKPVELGHAVAFKASNPKCTIVQGATDFGVWCNKRGFEPGALLSLDGVAGLDELRIDDGQLVVGGRVTLTRLEEFVQGKVPELARVLDRFGSPQIKNAGTLAGNIANASPIADTLPFLYVSDARLELTGKSGTRTVPIASFYRGYKTLDLAADEIITRIVVPLPARSDTLRLYKISKRSHLDISSFTAAMLMRRAGDRIDAIRIAYGGVAPVVLRLPRTESFLTGKPFSIESLEDAGAIAKEEITPIRDVRGSKEFRLLLAENVLKKFYYDVV